MMPPSVFHIAGAASSIPSKWTMWTMWTVFLQADQRPSLKARTAAPGKSLKIASTPALRMSRT